MNHLLSNLIEALREELTQYGELLALLDHQQEVVILRHTPDLLQSVTAINAQVETVQAARREREQHQRHVAQQLNLEEKAAFAEILPELPRDYRPLVQALVQENNELLVRVHQRARQNHLLLSRAVELMQRFINALFPGASPALYNEAGRLPTGGLPRSSLHEYIG
jgi:flagellar biosynthesis/type III secretory pathway chaperone